MSRKAGLGDHYFSLKTNTVYNMLFEIAAAELLSAAVVCHRSILRNLNLSTCHDKNFHILHALSAQEKTMEERLG